MLPNRLELLEPINSGRFATVYKANVLNLKQPVAVKILPKKRHDVSDHANRTVLRNEEYYAQLLCKGECPNIITVYDVFDDVQSLYIVMELCERTLVTKNMNMSDSINALKHINNALVYMHDMSLIHADVKPGNVVHDRVHDRYKLVDFGSTSHRGSCEEPRFVTPQYVAPELDHAPREITEKMDVWSLGMVAYEMLHDGKEYIPSNDLKAAPTLLQPLLTRMLDTNPYNRCSSRDAQRELLKL
jgi:serine/threonine protein kinase